MRLHRLSITAFGPFAETVQVDFDELTDAGLFLLAGPTGAGKTSVLDAVCFALYGEVPGDRAGAKHLRSDHAAPFVAPEVVLSVSVGARTFRFTRSPSWTRPKKRGSGTTPVNAHVVVEELIDTEWVGLSNRLDEAGHLVSGLLGMTCTQFTQVAMLPQGRFQSFLRATSPERHAVLQKLFRTDRFEQVERWLLDHRSALRQTSQLAQERTAAVVNRLQEAAVVPVPDEWDLHDLVVPAGSGALTAWSAELLAGAAAGAALAASEHTSALGALEHAADVRDAGARLHTARQQAALAQQTLEVWRTREGELDTLAQRLAAHRRVQPIHGLAQRAVEAGHRADAAVLEASERVQDAAQLLDTRLDISDADLTRAHEHAASARAVAEAFLPREAELHQARTQQRDLTVRLAEIDETIAAHEESLTTLGPAVVAGRTRLTELTMVAATQAALAGSVEVATRELAAARQVLVLSAALDQARDTLRATIDAAQDARESYHQIREARINGMAAELAGALASGCNCPVCGSASHPQPASAASGAVGKADEDAARKQQESAEFTRQAQHEAVTTLEPQLAAARATSRGASVEELSSSLGAQRESLRVASLAVEQATQAEQQLTQLERSVASTSATLTSARTEQTTTVAERDRAAALHVSLTTDLDALLSGSLGATTAAELVEEHHLCANIYSAARDAQRVADISERSAADARETAQAAASDAGFDDLEEALAALLTRAEESAAVAALDDATSATASARATLADPVVLDALTHDAPDLPALLEAHRAAAGRRDVTATALDRARARSLRLQQLGADLDVRLSSWAPVREAHALSQGLSTFMDGKGPDNPLKVRLSAYVLSERLRQVVEAANERLAKMSDQRYSLEHTDERGAGELRGGLSLRVRDDWNGTSRDPATLSGGETFVVSLALALGLADTVTHEAGGTDIDTLFIDEGFGSLDAETLEDVMDTLDSLRDGGRVVGIVSHVAELRTRITSQLEVSKTRNGSTIRPVLAGG